MKYDKNEIYMKLLQKTLINNNLTDGYDCNYEIYLTELINNSKFVKDFHGEFKLIDEQSHGECDISNKNYDIDYKLFVDNSLMESISLYSAQYIIDKEKACVAFCASMKTGSGKGYYLIKILRNYKYEDILRISNKLTKELKYEYERSIITLIINCEIDKNILFYLPYEIFFENIKINKSSAKFIIECLNSDIECILKYRNTKVNKDTYISFVSQDKMIIAQYIGNKLELYDIVNLNCSKIYQEILDLTTIWQKKPKTFKEIFF